MKCIACKEEATTTYPSPLCDRCNRAFIEQGYENKGVVEWSVQNVVMEKQSNLEFIFNVLNAEDILI